MNAPEKHYAKDRLQIYLLRAMMAGEKSARGTKR